LLARSASSSSRRAAASFAWAAAAARSLAKPAGQASRFGDRPGDQLARLAGQLQRRVFAVAGSSGERSVERPQPPLRGPRTVTHSRRVLTGQPLQAACLACERAGRIGRQPEIRGIADVGLDHGRVTAHRARHEPPLAGGRGDHRARDLLDDLRPEPADQLANR
jgi:hypothetical protein